MESAVASRPASLNPPPQPQPSELDKLRNDFGNGLARLRDIEGSLFQLLQKLGRTPPPVNTTARVASDGQVPSATTGHMNVLGEQISALHDIAGNISGTLEHLHKIL